MGFSERRLKATAKGRSGCTCYPLLMQVPMGYMYAMGYATRTNGFSRKDGGGFVPPIQLAACNASQSSGRCGLEPLACFLFWRLSLSLGLKDMCHWCVLLQICKGATLLFFGESSQESVLVW